ncbi:MAG TPA: TerB family tellurite resistance protein [Thermoanaerobaculia bacterium]|nr:TerB family tellurite resistance protein [Thermoanaerobaculia bacterium]
MSLFEDVELNDAQAGAVGRAMLAVARADGAADPREVALIEELAPVDTSAPDPTPAELAETLKEEKGRELLLRSVLLVALVDGDYSAAERAVVGRFAEALGVSGSRLEELASGVKAFLMAPLLPLANTSSVLDVSRKLKV